jgi:hypothetical protein
MARFMRALLCKAPFKIKPHEIEGAVLLRSQIPQAQAVVYRPLHVF